MIFLAQMNLKTKLTPCTPCKINRQNCRYWSDERLHSKSKCVCWNLSKWCYGSSYGSFIHRRKSKWRNISQYIGKYDSLPDEKSIGPKRKRVFNEEQALLQTRRRSTALAALVYSFLQENGWMTVI